MIPNFLDCQLHQRLPDTKLAARYQNGNADTQLVIHVSNFRPVKRATEVVEIFRRIRDQIPARLLLVGDGPDLPRARRVARDLGLAEDVEALGEQEQVVPLLSVANLFLLPSTKESFGVAALEAMACGVPVVASSVGGLPEVIEHGVSGFLHDPDDLEGMAASGLRVLTDASLRDAIAAGGLRAVHEKFCAEEVVPRYEQYYREVVDRPLRESPLLRK